VEIHQVQTFRATTQSEGWCLLAIAVTGFALRVASVLIFHAQPESDYLAYRTMAVNLIEGRGIIDNLGNYAMYNVGYPLFILAPVFGLFGNNLLPAQLINALLGVTCSVLCYAIASEIGCGRTGRLLAAALWALYLPSMLYAEHLAKENLMTVLMAGVIWCAVRLLKDVSLRTAASCGILLGLLVLTGNSGLALLLTALAAIFFAFASVTRKFVLFSVIVILAVCVTAPWIIRNARVLGSPVLNTNGGFNLYLGNNPAATGYFISIAETPRGKTWEQLRSQGELHASEVLRHEAIDWISKHQWQFVELALYKAVLFWKPPAQRGNASVSPIESILRRLWLLQFLFLVTGTIGSLLLPLGRSRQAVILFLAIASYTAVHMLFYVSTRYREPIMPVLCMLTALTLEGLVIRCRFYMRKNTNPFA
jgi:4-amino-4-deoxy-L-arabinose transferase-like glycosyltransferase